MTDQRVLGSMERPGATARLLDDDEVERLVAEANPDGPTDDEDDEDDEDGDDDGGS